MAALLILLAVLTASLLLTAAPLALVARLLHYPRRSFARCLLLILALLLLKILLSLPQLLLPPGAAFPYALLTLTIELLMTWALVKTLFQTTRSRAWGGVGGVVVGQILAWALVLGVVRPWLAEAYRTPTLAMAPTLLAEHHLVPCPKCGAMQPIELQWPLDDDPRYPLQVSMRCPACGTEWKAVPQKVTGPLFSADRFIVIKFLPLHRWDVLTYHLKRDILVKRLLGLPGEKLTITQDGRVLINGSAITPPADAPQTFPWPSDLRDLPAGLRPDRELVLGPDEYFVVGDNSFSSFDSRFAGPVHAADITGVLSARYWPLSRMALFR